MPTNQRSSVVDGVALVRELSHVWRDAAVASSLGAALEIVADGARMLLGVHMASISLTTGEAWSAGLTTASFSDERASWRNHAVLPDGMGIGVGSGVASRSAGVSVAELERDSTGCLAGQAAGHPPLRGLLSAPIVAEASRTLGILHISDRVDGGEFGDEDEVVLVALAQIAAMVITAAMMQQNMRAVVDHSPAAIFLKDKELRYIVANQRTAELVGRSHPAELIGRRDDELLPDADARRVMASDRAILDGLGDIDIEEPAHWPLEGSHFHVQAFAVHDDLGAPIGVGGVVSDVTARRNAEVALADSERRYRLLFENALDAILVGDDAGRLVEANPAACELLGLSRDEVLQRSMSDVVIDRWSSLSIGQEWDEFVLRRPKPGAEVLTRGYVRLRRPDGSIREAEFAAAPDAAPGLHLTVLRDATERRDSERLNRQRQTILDALARMAGQVDIGAQAAAVCTEIVARSDFISAAIFAFDATEVVLVGSALGPVAEHVTLPAALAGELADRIRAGAANGAWVDAWTKPLNGPPGIAEQLGLKAVAWAPIRADDRILGVLALGDGLPYAEMMARLHYVAELASIVGGSALGRALGEREAHAASGARIREIIKAGAFRPVFQAIVDLESGMPVGYEALTRFADDTPPDSVFAEARAAGVSLELEIATATAAMKAAGSLPQSQFIDINASPEFILAQEPLRSMLKEWGEGVILEITEHVEVTDYAAIRASIATIGQHVEVAVDDAGAGFASLRHILELRPALVKLDRGLISGVDGDPARQALVAGMVHFAARLHFTLVAEGVETPGERAALLALGVSRGQGYLFGLPASAEELTANP